MVCIVTLCGCGRAPDSAASAPLRQVVLQTDWFAQAEHGGFYQALARGFYREAGLDVVILQGGPNALSTQKILSGTATFAMNRADTIFALSRKGIAVQMLMATLRHDPQAILLHASNPIERLDQLDGQRIMAVPGLMWVRWLKARYQIDFEIIPHDFGLQRFLADPLFIQQCLLTNEPFYVRREGAAPKVLPLAASGFDPPHGIYALTETIETDPELVRAFVAASIRGWRDFIHGDPTPAYDLIAARNPRMTRDFMDFSRDTLRERAMVAPSDAPELTGVLPTDRLHALAAELQRLGLIEESATATTTPWFTNAFTRPTTATPK